MPYFGSVHPRVTIETFCHVVVGWRQVIFFLICQRVLKVDIYIIQVIQVCTSLDGFIWGWVLLATVLLAKQGKSYIYISHSKLHIALTEAPLYCTVMKLSYFDHQVARWVSGHSGKFTRQLLECWTDILINHPTWRVMKGHRNQLQNEELTAYLILGGFQSISYLF